MFYSLAQKAFISSAPLEHSFVPLQREENGRYSSSSAEHWNVLLTKMSTNLYETQRYCNALCRSGTCPMEKPRAIVARYPIGASENEQLLKPIIQQMFTTESYTLICGVANQVMYRFTNASENAWRPIIVQLLASEHSTVDVDSYSEGRLINLGKISFHSAQNAKAGKSIILELG